MTLKKIKTINSTTEFNTILSIQVSLSGLSFCMTDHKQEIITTKSITFTTPLSPVALDEELKKLLEKHQITQHNTFDKIQVIHDNELSNFVPKPFLDEKHLSDYLKYSNKIFETDFVTYDEIEPGEIVNVYIPFVNINNFILEHFGDFEYKHSSSIILEHLLNNTKEKHALYVCMQENSFQLFAFEDGKFLLHNTFNYQTKEDFIYYILFTAEQLQFSPEDFLLRIVDDITEAHELFKIAYTYIRNVNIIHFQSKAHQHITAKNLELLHI